MRLGFRRPNSNVGPPFKSDGPDPWNSALHPPREISGTLTNSSIAPRGGQIPASSPPIHGKYPFLGAILIQMEISVIPEKSRSLDLQSIYSEKSRAETRREETRPLKRKERSSSPAKERRKGRKELPLSTFEAEGSGTQKGTDALGQSGSNSVPSKLKGLMPYGKNQTKRKNGSVSVDGNWKNSSSNVSHESGDNGIVVPKRPRGFFGQKNLQSDRVGKRVVNSRVRRATNLGNGSSGKTSSEAQKSNLNGDLSAPVPSSAGKKKKAVDEFKENSSIQANSDLPITSEDASGNSAPRKIQRNSRKRQKQVTETSVSKVELPAVPNVVEVFEDVQEDDEENLEQNAARMLSSRFDPSCTGFSRNSAGSKSHSADGSLHPALFQRKFRSSGRSASAESEAVSVDSAGRVLRPRKQHRHRGLFRRRRRHFYEINSTELDAYWVVNQRIKVFWPLDMSWYFGVVKEYDPKTNLHHVKYDDRDEEWINLQNERFKLLLLPGEVPGKISPEKSGIRRKHVEEDDANGLNDDSCVGNFMESEPIISWLARSTRRVKSSPLGIAKKQKRCHTVKNNLHSTSSDNTVEISNRCLADGLARTDTDELSIGSVMLEKSMHREMADQSIADSCAHPKDRKRPLVYSRRRFRKVQPVLNQKLEKRSVTGSVTLPVSLADRVGVLEDFDIIFQDARMKTSKHLGQQSLLQLQEHFCMPKLFDSSTEVEVKMRLYLPPLRVYDLAFGPESFWYHNTLLLLQFGRLMTAWPTVHLEMLFMDNIVGLRYLLFEGCLRQAASFMCFILGIFQQPGERGMHDDLQLPVTSIRFQLSGLQDLGRRLVFVFYNFLEIESSKWLCLDNKLKRYCLVAKELPLAECTYDNITMLQSGVDQNVNTPVIEEPACHQMMSPEKRTRQGIKHWGYSSSKFKERPGGLPPFVLSFAAAPSFFHSLHLKMLMKNDVASISFQNSHAQENPKKYLMTSRPSVNQVLDKNDNVDDSVVEDAVVSKRLSCVETTALPVSRDANWTNSSQNTALNATGAGVDSQELQMHKNSEDSKQADKLLCHSDSLEYAGRSCSSASEDLSAQDESESRFLSSLTGANLQTPPLGQVDGQSIDKGGLSTQLCMSDLAWNVTDGTIRSTNPTAPRTMWHRSRRSSFPSSFSNHSKLWPDGSADFARNGFANGSRKPRSQVAYLSPFGGYSFGSKPRSHLQKGHPYKRIKNENEKILSDGWRSSQLYTSCNANVLVTAADRGWRECGAQIVLESADRHDWRLSVKISGTTRYVYKAHQFLQPGTTNRYTHVMMWKGGKDWILEFPDRSQWTLFKMMHEECYNRNIRAASVKNIPIPGVRLIEDSDDNAIEVPYVRNSPMYFRLVGTEVDMAMDPTRVFYDIESDDEQWILEFRNAGVSGTQPPEISDEIFEKVMDMFEKVSYAQQREDFSNDEIECFMGGVGPMEIVKAVYDHWQQKRKKKGMPLIRQLQPPLWERYQQQLKDWELVVSRTANHSNGCKEKVLPEKPPMFAFCLRPRGLEVPNKGTKQRSHRKFTTIGQYGSFSRDLDVPQTLGRKLNGFAAIGDEKALVTVQNHESLEVSPRLQFSLRSSPRDVTATGILSISSDGSERNQLPVSHRTKSKKMGVYLAPGDLQMATTSYSPRTMGKKNGANRWNTGMPEWPTLRQYQGDGFQRHRVDQLGCSEFDEFRLRDASSAAQHASNMAKLKREKAQRLMHKADVALHKAASALMVAEAMRASEEDLIGDG
ncbi:hypothetical protein ACLOJK_019929 [Asimina triloba]